jgi:VIT1/CCC1 family predicted Fe2+/Mn2+ transporter
VERKDDERGEVLEILEGYGLSPQESHPILAAFEQRPKVWVDWMMRFELGLEEPVAGRATRSAITIALSYIAGGLIPLTPYIVQPDAAAALRISVVATILALAAFGGVKGHFTVTPMVKSGFRTAVIGGLAAGAAFGLAKLFS